MIVQASATTMCNAYAMISIYPGINFSINLNKNNFPKVSMFNQDSRKFGRKPSAPNIVEI